MYFYRQKTNNISKESRKLGGRNIRTRSQAIIDDKLLIDFPADTYMHFIKENINMSEIHTCIVTHSHADHLYPSDLEVRRDGFAHLKNRVPLTLYSDESSYLKINEAIEKFSIPSEDIVNVRIFPFETFNAEGYRITSLRASHDPKSSPLLFVIEKDDKSIFYSNDSSEYCEENFECLKRIGHPIDVISLDCTEACNHSEYVGHLNIFRCKELRERLINDKIADKNTVFVLNHFSHNGANVVYDDFVKIAEKEGFLVSYDGMELCF